jgi:ribokinase
MLVCALGDLTLDVVVELRSEISMRGDTDAGIRVSTGGQAANVAAWAAALGAGARYLGKRGADDAGTLAASGLASRGVEVAGPAEGRGGVICSIVEPGGERSMLSDRGSAVDLRPDELEPAWFAGCGHLFVSGYALFREPLRSTAVGAVALARAEGAAISVDLASWSEIRAMGANALRALVERLAPDVVFANEDEERVLGGRLTGPTWILKRGSRGCAFGEDERSALSVECVLDTTGAGDALAAGYIVGGPELALAAAARCVSRLGSMP